MRCKKPVLVAVVFSVFVLAVTLTAGCGEKEVEKPEITTVVPPSGQAGTEVTLVGDRFGSQQGDSVVHVGDRVADVVAWSDEEITLKIPDGLAAAEYDVSVLTDDGVSNTMEFTVTGKAAPAPDRKEGQVEHTTPVSAMLDYMKKKNIDSTGMTFSVVSISESDPDWKIDEGSKAGQSPVYFMLHRDATGDWDVVDYGTAFNAKELEAMGAPADLLDEPPAPATQAKAVWNFIKSRGGNPAGVVVNVTRVSTADPKWELGTAQQGTQPRNLVAFHYDGNRWTVRAYGASLPATTLSQLRVPADLAPNPQIITDYIKSEEQGVEPGNWTLSLIKVSTADPDWEMYSGQEPGQDLMYFIIHWENNAWVVKDSSGTPKQGEVPGAPPDVP